jgi:prophage tail gpP-like protein
MQLRLTNRRQKTVTINGKRNTAKSLIRRAAGLPTNQAGNRWLDDAHELIVLPYAVVIHRIDGMHVAIDR